MVRFAAEQGREVMAVPGNVLTGCCGGSHALIRDGAKIVETADDILLDEMGLDRGVEDAARVSDEGPDPVFEGMEIGESVNIDGLIARSGLEASALMSRLTELEIAGRVVRTGTGRFVRVRVPE